ncbi:type II toxin-antitoxin system antitoxin DNA ADP-ribosyl glycohydrolase DarG [Pacificibacter marinus]|uniref:RNase III inhibitor n=1 Tax=Pacificibacter marinus TaxID=658057 RepID=A0A1Y5TJH9_9RHOB|nr:macro domain-containing protein [Pacificibacter marinus]SEL38955.1 O-acetyl-ADP-ribose deacetylase (regulator of RNase III), contains Macro domain [Pacificibacter marinus]SLN65752.1 RNase III inhibitor [Pacificibacter marinus]
MAMTFKKGDMFNEQVEAVVNTVNCVGVMGKGVALEFKNRWPANFKAYKRICESKELVPGQMFVFDTEELFASEGPRYLVNFPTKAHWRSKSKISYIEDGLDALVKAISEHGIKSIAIPPLGCGNGGLDWADVRPLIVSKLEGLQDVEIVIFPPMDAVDEPEHAHSKLTMTYARAMLLKTLNDLERFFDGSFDRISLQKLAYFLQALGIDLKLKFARNDHGPYSEMLKKAYLAFEGNGMIRGFTTDDRQAHVTPSGCAIAEEYLSNQVDQSSDETVGRLSKLVQGYESPYGLELLSSVHWLAHHENHCPVEKIIAEMQGWNENKRNSFSDEAIRSAYQRLQDDGLLT